MVQSLYETLCVSYIKVQINNDLNKEFDTSKSPKDLTGFQNLSGLETYEWKKLPDESP